MAENAAQGAQTSGGAERGEPVEVEPEIPGTLFLTTLLLIMIFGFWALMYWTLINR